MDYRLQTWGGTPALRFKHRDWKVWADVAVNLHIDTQPLNADVRLYIEDANDVLLQPVKDELARLGLPVQDQWYEKSCWVGSWILPCDLGNLAHKVVELTRILMSVDAAR